MDVHRAKISVAAATLATIVLSGIAPAALAGSERDERSQVVRFDDLNLASEAGVRALYLRIRNAAGDVCGPSQLAGSHVVSEAWKDCVSSAVRTAILKVNRPTLTAYYAARLRQPFPRIEG